MSELKIGDIVARKSYGGDVYFRITDIINKGRQPVYVLRGMLHRLTADSSGDDLEKQDPSNVFGSIRRDIYNTRKQSFQTRGLSIPLFFRFRVRSGLVLHLDADGDFLEKCLQHYSEANVKAIGKRFQEAEQPHNVRRLLQQYNPDILVVTGHDGFKKGSENIYSIDNYSSSKYFVQSVKEARAYQPDPDKLCVFAGACQSYYEAIMEAGANFASSPGRILIKALDPALVSEKVALTDERQILTPSQVVGNTESGSKGVWGISTRGQAIIN